MMIPFFDYETPEERAEKRTLKILQAQREKHDQTCLRNKKKRQSKNKSKR